MQETLRVTLAADIAPTQAIMDKWEMDEQWVTVKAESMRTLTGETDGRPWSLISFQATEVKEVSPQERQQLQDARKTSKAKKKAARAKAKADRAAAKAAGSLATNPPANLRRNRNHSGRIGNGPSPSRISRRHPCPLPITLGGRSTRSRCSTICCVTTRSLAIIYALVLNTALAQLFYNSAGVVLPNSDWRFRYLVFSAFLSMLAFSLFELHTVRQLKDLLGKEKGIRAAFAALRDSRRISAPLP